MSSRSKRKQIISNEKQDAEGISRRRKKFTCSPQLFMWIKLGLTLLIPAVYFLYSPLLVVLMLCYVGLFFLARMAENAMNKSVIRKNHVFIPKFDSAIALLVVLIAMVGGVMSLTEKTKPAQFADLPQFSVNDAMDGRFKQMQRKMKWNRFVGSLENFGSLLTGTRNVFEKEKEFSFTPMEPPEDFVIDSSQLPEPPEGMDFPMEFGKAPGGFRFDISDLPIAYVASSALSTVNSVLVFSVAGFGALSLLITFIKRRRFERDMNEVIAEDKIILLSDEEIEAILSFGEDVEST